MKKLHPLEKFAFTGFVVGILMPARMGLVAVAIAVIAGVFLMIGQSLRHREIRKKLK